MFVNGDAIGVVIKLLVAGMTLLCLALVSHVVWISSLVRSRALGRFGPVAGTALLALAAATPVVSFYCLGILRHRGRHALHPSPAGTGRALFGTVGAIAAGMLALLTIVRLRQPMPGAHGSDVFSLLPGLLLVLVVPCAVLVMACQVLVQSSQARMALIVVAGGMAACLLLLV